MLGMVYFHSCVSLTSQNHRNRKPIVVSWGSGQRGKKEVIQRYSFCFTSFCPSDVFRTALYLGGLRERQSCCGAAVHLQQLTLTAGVRSWCLGELKMRLTVFHINPQSLASHQVTTQVSGGVQEGGDCGPVMTNCVVKGQQWPLSRNST